jgi:copper chaperone CopZ
MNSGDRTTKVENILDAVAGVISVKIDSSKSEAQITSKGDIEMDTFEQALADTDYYITKKTANNWVAAPSFRNVANNARQRHNASRDVEGSNSSSASTGPVTDYDKD